MDIKSFHRRTHHFLIWAIVITTIFSCKSVSTATTSVQVINASPDAGPVNFYLSGTLKTSAPVAYGNSLGYFSTIAGNQTGEVKASPSNNTLVSAPVSLASDVNYSVFISGLASANTVNFVAAQDNLITPAPGRVKIRFVQLISGAPQVNLLANSIVLFSFKAYKSVSDYTEITAGTYSIKVISADPAATNITTAFNQTFENGRIYTVYLKGTIGAVADALKPNLGVMRNN